ncbi:MAG: ABC transporter substrate-binding protein [Syntrophales bacterium]|jgi:ABC-type branched-subunit amino acid transport system substrate-binding protein|nr:ABC transporter substrate-binding protein [Syntrophales bacterium]MDY0043692.1 ABC transporter substrate-binding protein [Syntrophales bacterium]
MKQQKNDGSIVAAFLCLLVIIFTGFTSGNVSYAMPGFDMTKMSDMSDYNPNNPAVPTGDTIKIGLIEAFSGPGALSGDAYNVVSGWVAHDINKRGGILVDGKKKKIQIIKGDDQSKPAITKKVAEKLCLEDKVNFLAGVTGSHLTLIVQNVAQKYKIPFMSYAGYSDELMNGANFNRYTFRVRQNTSMLGALGYYYAQRPEKKFYILCQDYAFGHAWADAVKDNLKKHKPDAEIVGEEYHPLFLKDFAPYLTKVLGSGAEVILSANWGVDIINLIKQVRELGSNIPVAGYETDIPVVIGAVKGKAGAGLVVANDHCLAIDTPENKALVKAWTEQWPKWGGAYESRLWQYPTGSMGATTAMYYWLMDIIERAGTVDPEKIIATWEGDEYRAINGVVKMRACDHQVVRDMAVAELVYPNKWFEGDAGYGEVFMVPSQYCTPPLPDDLERCKK